MWIKVTVDITSMGGKTDTHPAMINPDHVKKIAPTDGARTKITFADGETIRVVESYTKIEAMLDGSLERAYKHKEPEDV